MQKFKEKKHTSFYYYTRLDKENHKFECYRNDNSNQCILNHYDAALFVQKSKERHTSSFIEISQEKYAYVQLLENKHVQQKVFFSYSNVALLVHRP
jgi:hypothetical protein